ncbi:hypothetical protein DEU56DRAFT_840600 [Suillus clintonianus]|uniref:uncharacterized protein n=1 Tax=Suillus clintonianus TaxID=1904413 RepID=UPI001B8633F0|nr:uncharacterized protein DEU56DRAFT_840600 [Suillus clintonianus]KAG2115620.1 hypothetical protein DEU56DRAFT_840600 [Suillus clintonianus]
MKLKPDLERLIIDKEAKERCVIYKALLIDLAEQGYGVEVDKRLSFLARLKIFELGPIFKKARPGYYGPKGSIIFRTTINKLFDPVRKAIPTDTFAPLSFEQYTYFVLIPFMATRLIADDRGFTGDQQQCTLEQAFDIMVATGDVGETLQAIDEEGKDEGFDNVLMKITLNKVTKLDYLPAASPQREKGRKPTARQRSSKQSNESACRRSARLALSQR